MSTRTTCAALAALIGATALATSALADQTFGVDNGAHITMWSRAATQARADALVQAYNASHKNHIDVTYVPTDDYQTKVGAAAAANSLPDLFSADVVFMPNWTSAGLFQDITARIATLPFAAEIAQGAITRLDLGRQEIRPAVRRRSFGLDVQQEAIQASGPRPGETAKIAGRVRGRRPRGRQAGRRRPRHLLRRRLRRLQRVHLVADRLGRRRDGHEPRGHRVAPQQRGEQGDLRHLPRHGRRRNRFDAGLQDGDRADLDRLFPQGKDRHHADAGKPARHGQRGPRRRGYRRRCRSPASRAGQSTFIGGDAIGISRDSKVADAAWNFLAWLQSDDAQINVVAKGGNVLSRPDLANNKYSATDPRLVLFNSVAKNGQTPFAKNFGATFNDPQGPWLVLLRDAVFGDASKVDADNKAINSSLNP